MLIFKVAEHENFAARACVARAAEIEKSAKSLHPTVEATGEMI